MDKEQENRTSDVIAVERVIDSGLSLYPDTFDKVEAKRRLIELYKKMYEEIQAAQDKIIAELMAERIRKESAQERRRFINPLKKLT